MTTKTTRLGGYLMVAAALSGCAANDITGRRQVTLISDQSVISRSTSMYSEMVGSYERKSKLSTDEALVKRLTDITNRVIDQAVKYRPESAKWNWELAVIDEDKLNAFCMPGGKMGIYRGIVEKLDLTDDEVAMIMGHEIAHAVAGHGAERMSTQMAANIALVIIAAAATKNNRERDSIVQLGSLGALAFINLPNSRTGEEEADRLGIEFASRAGYNPDAAASVWRKMGKKTGQTSRVDFLSSHPAPIKREENLRGLAQLMRAQNYEPKDVTVAGNPWIRKPHNRSIGFDKTSYASNLQPVKLATYIDPDGPPADVQIAALVKKATESSAPNSIAIAKAPFPPAVAVTAQTTTTSTEAIFTPTTDEKIVAALLPATNYSPSEPQKTSTPASTLTISPGSDTSAPTKIVSISPAGEPTIVAAASTAAQAPAQAPSLFTSLTSLIPGSVTTSLTDAYNKVVAFGKGSSDGVTGGDSTTASKSPAASPIETIAASIATTAAAAGSQNQQANLAIIVLRDCDKACQEQAAKVSADLHNMYQQEKWPELAEALSLSGFKSDLHYVYLGRAAMALGQKDAAHAHLNTAVTLSKDSAYSCGAPAFCQGIDVGLMVADSLKKLN